MPLETIQWVASVSGLFFTFCFGAIVGSFLNVVVYRLPKNLNLIRPPSACPACGTRLPWKYNFPILGWLRVRGRCAFCKTKISPEYPLVELFVALLFSATYVAWFMRPSLLELVGVDAWAWTPEWALGGVLVAWPYWLALLIMFASLVAITLIDAKTFMIPLSLPWLMGGVGLVVHPLHAWWLDATGRLTRLQSEAHEWTIPLAEGPWFGAAMLGGVGIIASALLLAKGWMPRSYGDYEEWEARTREEMKRAREAGDAPDTNSDAAGADDTRSSALRAFFFAGPGVAGMFVGMSIGMNQPTPTSSGPWLLYGLIGLALGLCLGLLLRRVVPQRQAEPVAPEVPAATDDDFLWTLYPYARREMMKEVLFLLPGAALAALGWWLFSAGGPLGGWSVPIALEALGGSVLGLLVGGGVVWAVRILGSIAFNKEAMGLGDVHLMAGVGAVLGWVDPTLAFFLAPFTGILWVVLSTLSKVLFNREGAYLPYGPQLALMTVALVLFKPLAEAGLTALMGDAVNLP